RFSRDWSSDVCSSDLGSWALECDEFLSRTAFDGMPESQLISVPQAYYHRAWVLFAVDPDPARDPLMTVRLTRYASSSRVGRGDEIGRASGRDSVQTG